MRYVIFYKAQKGICPRCSGLMRTLKSDTIILNCIDCDLFLKIVGQGQADSELIFEEAEIKY